MAGRITAWRWRTPPAESYAGVLIPLEQAHLHSHSARCGRAEYEEVPGDDEDDDPKYGRRGSAGSDETTGMLEMRAAEYSIAGLRKEVRRMDGGGGSEYESEFGCSSAESRC